MPELDVQELISSVAERGSRLAMSRSPEEIRRLYAPGRSRPPGSVVARRAGVLIVAALVVVVFFVPLPQVSLFRRIVGSHPSTVPTGSGPGPSAPFTPGDVVLSSTGGKVFVLGTAPCGKHLCGALWLGSGGLFVARVAPPGVEPGYPGDTGSVSELVFANALDGYALESPWTTDARAYETTDGGLTWRRVSFGPGDGLVDVVASDGAFYGLLLHCQQKGTSTTCGDYRLARSATGTATWSSVPIPGSSGLNTLSIGLAVSGPYVTLLVPTRAVGDTLLRSSGGESPLRVVARQPVLIAVQGACDLTATSPSSLWAMCPTGMLVGWFHSGDGGHSFMKVWVSAGTIGATLDPVSGAIAFRYTGLIPKEQDQLQLTRNGGLSFSTIGRLPFAPGIRVELGFLNAQSGYALGSVNSSLKGQELLRTSDGGRHWTRVRF